MSNVSIRDVAAHAQVSMATVSNTLNNPARVSKKMRTKVLAAVAELGYVPNESARALRTGRSAEIGLLVHDIRNPFFADLAHAADTAAEAVGDVVTLCSSAGSLDREGQQLRRLVRDNVKGIIIDPLYLDALNPKDLLGKAIPVVIMARRPAGNDHCSVWVDDMAGGELATNYMLDQGHRRLAFIGTFLDRLRGARHAISAPERGQITMLEIAAEGTIDGGRVGGEQIVAMDPTERPTGLVCGNDLIALGVLQALAGANIRVPEDVALIGYDDIAYGAAGTTPLTTIRQPRDEMGRAAVRLLLDEIADQDTHHHRSVVFPPKLIIRQSA